jgi:hypothetical protein
MSGKASKRDKKKPTTKPPQNAKESSAGAAEKKKKQRDEKTKTVEQPSSGLIEFTNAAYNRQCLSLKRRCIFIFGSSTTFLSAQFLFRHLPQEFGEVRVPGKASPLETRFLFVSSHAVRNVSQALWDSFTSGGESDVNDDVSSHSSERLPLCGAMFYSATKNPDRRFLGEYCVVVLSSSAKRFASFGKYAGTGGSIRAEGIRSEAHVRDIILLLERDADSGAPTYWRRLSRPASMIE